MNLLRLLLRIGCGLVSVYWIGVDLRTYLDGPVSSTITSKFGDDNMGGIIFPSILVCHTNLWPNLLPLPCGQNATSMSTFLTSCFSQQPNLTLDRLMASITVDYAAIIAEVEAVKNVEMRPTFYPKWGSCVAITNVPPIVNLMEAQHTFYQMRLRLKPNSALSIALHHDHDLLDLADNYPFFTVDKGSNYVLSLEKKVTLSIPTSEHKCTRIPFKSCYLQKIAEDLRQKHQCQFSFLHMVKFTVADGEDMRNLPNCSDDLNKQGIAQFMQVYQVDMSTLLELGCSLHPTCTSYKYSSELDESPRSDASGIDLLIRMRTTKVEYVKDSYKYQFINFAGEVSGILGLMWGLSVSSLIDALDFLKQKCISLAKSASHNPTLNTCNALKEFLSVFYLFPNKKSNAELDERNHICC